MLLNFYNQTNALSETLRFLVAQALQTSYLAQQMAGLEFHVPYSSHLLSYLQD